MHAIVSTFYVSPEGANAAGLAQILAALAQRAQSDLGRRSAQNLPYLPTAAAMAKSMAVIDEARRLAQAQMPVPAQAFADIGPLLRRLGIEATLEGKELLQVAEVLDAIGVMRRFAQVCAPQAPQVAAHLRGLKDVSAPLAMLRSALAPDGHVVDDASADLRQARAQVRSLTQRIRSQMEGYLTSPAMSGYLMDTYVSVRHDRYVLPINASFASKVPGIIHNASQTGQTVFIEPAEITGLGNALALAESREAEEVLRVLGLLCAEVAPYCGEIEAGMATLTHMDVVAAAARLAEDLQLSTPRLVAHDGPLQLEQVLHPGLRLTGHAPIGNAVRLGEPHQVLLISGPNGGGKTVILTGVGLAVLMSRVGLPIAAAPNATLPAYQGLFCAVGDAQNLAQGLSSFAGQLMGFKDMVARAAPGFLALVDELGGDTDPVVGAAIARAVLDHCVDCGAHVCATTHLAALKALPLTDERYVNARMGYDPAAHAPTFRLEWGAAGVSRGLDLARRLGLPEPILAAAQAHMGEEGAVSEALAELERGQQAVHKQSLALAGEQALLVLQHEAQQAAAEKAELQRAQAQTDHEAGLRRLYDAAQAEVRALQAQLREKNSVDAARKAAHALGAKAAQVPPAPAPGFLPVPLAKDSLRPGMRVRVRALGKDAQVVAVEGNHVTVAMGALRTRVHADGLVRAEGDARVPGPSKATSGAPAKAVSKTSAQAQNPRAPSRCDVRGLRLDEAERLLVRALDVCLSEGQQALYVVHGHGTGQLRDGVRDLLQGSPYVSSFRAAEAHEGGDGMTVVQLDR